MTSEMVVLKSGPWRMKLEKCRGSEVMELIDPVAPTNKMVVTLPSAWRGLRPEELQDHMRRPDVRIWRDEVGFVWRVAAVGPGTRYDYPLRDRHLVFDSKQTYAGIVQFASPLQLGDLTNEDLARLRDRISDFGGRRRHFRYSTG